MDTITAIKLAAKLAPKRGLPILSTVLLDFGAGAVRSTDLDTQVEILIDSAGNRGRHILDAAGARKLSPKAQFTMLDDGKLQVTEHGIIMPIVSDLPIEDMPDFPAVVDTSATSFVNGPSLFSRALAYVSTEPSRYAINRLSLNCGVAATDGRRLFFSTGYTGEGQVLIAVPAVRLVASLPDGTMRVRRKGNLVSFTIGDVQVTTRIGEGDFPNVLGIMPTASPVVRVQTTAGDLDKWMALRRASTKDIQAFPAEQVWPDIVASFNASLMVDILSTMPDATLEFRDGEKPLVVRSVDAVALLMPVCR